MNEKDTIRRALLQYRGDNHLRAEAAFRGLSPEQMATEYGQSGETRQAILDKYRAHAAECDAALAWLEKQK